MRRTEPIAVEPSLLARHPLPPVAPDTTKDGRGSVLVIGGTRQTPGGVLLAGLGSLRAGAGRVCLATVESASSALAARIPEARVVGFPEAEDGCLSADAADGIVSLAVEHDAVLLGPGTVDPDTVSDVVAKLLATASADQTIVLDAAALAVSAARPDAVRESDATVLLIPNPKEMGRLLNRDEQAVTNAPITSLEDAVKAYRTSMALRGADTWITAPGEAFYVDCHGVPALATAGSGDVFAGALAGLLARGASPLAGMLWAVRAHSMTGTALARELGTGVLATDLVTELPRSFVALETQTSAERASRLSRRRDQD